MKTLIISLLCMILFIPSLLAQSVVGDWEGTLEVQGTSLPVIFHIVEGADGSLSGTMDSPKQGASGIPMDAVGFENGMLTIKAASMGLNYSGKVLEGRVKGKFMQGGMTLPLALKPVAQKVKKEQLPVKTLASHPVAGDWYGALETMGMKLRLVFHVSENADGSLSATLDSPDQKAFGIPANEVTFKEEKLTIHIPTSQFLYEGVLDEKSATMKGILKQLGQEIPLNMSREEIAVEKVKRPQTPKAPYNYEVEEVTFVNESAAIELAGTLTKPKGAGPFPVAVMISGSGAQDRNEEILEHKPFWVIADYLTQQGIAVLRFDDRGFGESEGDFASATSADFATDVDAAVAFLRDRKDIDAGKVGLIGHSEGGMIAPMVASRDKEIAFIILLAAPGISSLELMPMQVEISGKASGVPAKMAKMNAETMKGAYEIMVKEHASEEALQEELRAYFQAAYAAFPEAHQPPVEDLDRMIASNAKQLSTPWFQYFIKFDPSDYLRQVKCPVLAINGAKDVQVPAKVNLEGIKASLKQGGNRNVVTHNLKDLNHLFQNCETGSVLEYGKIEETFSVEVLELMEKWLLERPLR